MITPRRLRAAGPHYARMKLVASGEASGEPTVHMQDLISWGYVVRDGDKYGFTEAGQKYWDTVNNMRETE